MRGDFDARGTVANTTEWGTMRYSALELIQDALNLKTPTVYDRIGKTDRSSSTRKKPKPRATNWRRSKSASKRGSGKTMNDASGFAENTMTNSTPYVFASSTAAI